MRAQALAIFAAQAAHRQRQDDLLLGYVFEEQSFSLVKPQLLFSIGYVQLVFPWDIRDGMIEEVKFPVHHLADRFQAAGANQLDFRAQPPANVNLGVQQARDTLHPQSVSLRKVFDFVIDMAGREDFVEADRFFLQLLNR